MGAPDGDDVARRDRGSQRGLGDVAHVAVALGDPEGVAVRDLQHREPLPVKKLPVAGAARGGQQERVGRGDARGPRLHEAPGLHAPAPGDGRHPAVAGHLAPVGPIAATGPGTAVERIAPAARRIERTGWITPAGPTALAKPMVAALARHVPSTAGSASRRARAPCPTPPLGRAGAAEGCQP